MSRIKHLPSMYRKGIKFSSLPSTEAALVVTLLWGVHNKCWSLWEWREKWRVEKSEEFTITEEGSKPASRKKCDEHDMMWKGCKREVYEKNQWHTPCSLWCFWGLDREIWRRRWSLKNLHCVWAKKRVR